MRKEGTELKGGGSEEGRDRVEGRKSAGGRARDQKEEKENGRGRGLVGECGSVGKNA